MKSIIAASALLLTAAPSLAGTAVVSFVDPAGHADAGRRPGEAEQVQAELSAFLGRLAADRLPPDRTITIDVLDIDLAGEPRPPVRREPQRIVKGGADRPRIELRYTLRAGDSVLSSGQEVVQDLDYLSRARALRAEQTLPYEKHMLERWFAARFGAAR